MSEETKIIVIDVGSCTTRAGFSGQEEPQFVTRSVVGTRNGKTFVGNKVKDTPSQYNIKLPFMIGSLHKVTYNYDVMTEIYNNIFSNLHTDPSEHGVFICKPPKCGKEDLEKTIEIMFEKFNVPLYTSYDSASFALFCHGSTTGVILESGDLYTSIVPIYDGKLIPHLVKQIQFAGEDITKYLSRLLMKQNLDFHTFREMEELKAIKEKYCFVADDLNNVPKSEINCVLQENKKAILTSEVYGCPELMFNPGFNGFEYDDISKMLFDTINQCEENIRKDIYANIHLSGGNTMFKGFPERIEKEIVGKAPITYRTKIIAHPERINGAWIGGSIVADLLNFRDYAITRDEYDDAGPGIIHRKNYYTITNSK